MANWSGHVTPNESDGTIADVDITFTSDGTTAYNGHRKIDITVSYVGVYSFVSSVEGANGITSEFIGQITGLTPGTRYNWNVTAIYYMAYGEWVKVTPTPGGMYGGGFTTIGETGINYTLNVYSPKATKRYLKLQFNANGGTGAPSAVTGNTGSGTSQVEVDNAEGGLIDSGTTGSDTSPWVSANNVDSGVYIWITTTGESEINRARVYKDQAFDGYIYPSNNSNYFILTDQYVAGAKIIEVYVELTGSSDLVQVKIPKAEPSRSGWKFDGWAEDANGGGTRRYPEGTYTNTGSTSQSSPATYTLYAVWTQDGDPYVWLFGKKSTEDYERWHKIVIWLFGLKAGEKYERWHKIRVWVDANSGNHWKGGVQ